MKELIKKIAKTILPQKNYERLYHFLFDSVRSRLGDAYWPVLSAYCRARRRLSRKMVVHVYGVCWNEETILPYFLRHYASIADKITIFDNMSTDNSVSIIKKCPIAKIIPYDSGGQVRDDIYTQIKNNAWKRSRGLADWVIFVDMDEFIWHKDLTAYLKECKRNSITLLVPKGFDMVSNALPKTSGMIYDEIKAGFFNRFMCKPCIFDPNAVREINFAWGSHHAKPAGRVVLGRAKELKLLHYKMLGLDRFLKRSEDLAQRQSEFNRSKGLGFHQRLSRDELISWFNYVKNKARDVI